MIPEDIHHKSLVVELSLGGIECLKTNTRRKYLYRLADYGKINSSLDEINWEDCLNGTSLENAVHYFYNILYDLRDRHIPHKLVSPSKFPVWYNAALKKVLKEKYKYHKKYRTYGNISDYDTFSLLRKRAKALEQECYKAYLKKSEESIIENPKMFWSFIKSNKQGANSLPANLEYEGQSSDSGEKICELFASYFKSTFLSPSSNVAPKYSNANASNHIHSIGDIEINADSLNNLLKSLDLTKGAGPDLIEPTFIVNCSRSLTRPLAILFKRSVTEGIVPALWKSAFITPIHKSGNKCLVNNYRPISKLCLFAKVFERIVYTQVYNSLSSIFIPEQHGFLKKRSTTSNLISFTEFVTSGMDAGGEVHAIFTDYCKAFDRIDHSLLLQKLLSAGIHGNLFRWFSSYIENRTQAVAVNGYCSKWCTVPSGVPQGSLLGPLLFNIFINDISCCFLHSNFLLYADDMKIYKQIQNTNDCQKLQDDLRRFEEYCNLNKLDLNISKCHSICFSRKCNVTHYLYTLRGTRLQNLTEVRDLGVIHDSKLTYELHVDSVVKRANRTLGFIMRSCSQFQSVKVAKVLYCSYVRSILEYCSQIWNPQYNIYIDRLECVQRKFMRYLQYKSKTYIDNYIGRCSRHHILPLQDRRKIADIVFLLKVAQCKIDSPHLLSLINLRAPSRTLRRPITLSVPHSISNYRQNSFFIRAANVFNLMAGDSDIDLFNSSINSVKRNLFKDWFDVHS
ncbi:hypothetical protein ABMA28_004807 [Loxostege sticticalis]|uniref:Reverse transcriptase domain-containing protein n=1 Tax=Loxostege sticticalis TaxID=481309 RepID=A0ABD0ST20_LOXSC